jgi:hypothetical protein
MISHNLNETNIYAPTFQETNTILESYHSDNECYICLEPLTNTLENPGVVLACGHELHDECFHKYISHNMLHEVKTNKCPVCKKVISVNAQTLYNIKFIKKQKGVSKLMVGILFMIQMFQLTVLFAKSQIA